MIKKIRKGFTLVELVVVIAVIAILAAVSIVSYMGITKKAKESNDHMMIDQINLSVASTSIPNRKATIHGMLEDLKENAGFGVEKIKPELEGTEFVYSYSMNKFAYWKNNDVVYPEDVKNNPSARGTDLWFFVDLDSNGVLAKGHSYYLKSSQSKVVTTDGGLDVGNQSVETITYNCSSATDNKKVTIRTNSASTTLIIDDASEGTIYHYGSAGALNIIQCHTASYHENGNVGFAEIAKGRMVLENGSEIKHIHVNAKENENEFDTVIIADNGAEALPEAITRDQVDVSEAKPFVTVESGSTSETVYVYPYTDAQETKTGTTEQTLTQNTTIASPLGLLVLDNGNDAGEKAMSDNEKAELKIEVVNDAKVDEAVERKTSEENLDKACLNAITNVYYDTFAEAFTAVQNNEAIVMLKDDYTLDVADLTSAQSLSNKKVKLNLNGKKLVSNGSRFEIGQNSELTINGNGTIEIRGIGKNDSGILVSNNSTLNFENGSLFVENNSGGYNKTYGIFGSNNSIINIGKTGTNGPTIEAGVALTTNGSAQFEGCTFNVYSGTLIGNRSQGDGDSNVVQLANQAGINTINIYGGKFIQSAAPADGLNTIFELRYAGTKNINIYRGEFACGQYMFRFNASAHRSNVVINDQTGMDYEIYYKCADCANNTH